MYERLSVEQITVLWRKYIEENKFIMLMFDDDFFEEVLSSMEIIKNTISYGSGTIEGKYKEYIFELSKSPHQSIIVSVKEPKKTLELYMLFKGEKDTEEMYHFFEKFTKMIY